MKKILCITLSILMSAIICAGVFAESFSGLNTSAGATAGANSSLFAPGGVRKLIPPITVMYASDGRISMVKTAEIALHKSAGWYEHPVCTMYAADGRTLVVKATEVELYKTVGWYEEPVVMMYAVDGRTLPVIESEVELYKTVGWFDGPAMTVYAVDGRTLDIKQSELEAYLNVGWYQSPADFPIPKGPLVALTFDDGPSKYTERILDCLEQHGAKATFFVVGNSVNAYPSVLKRAYDLGMEIGNHTMTHPNLKTLSSDGVSRELKRASDAIVSVTGSAPALIRPPYGNYNSTVSGVANAPLILWSIDTLDWKTRNADKTVNCVLNEVKDGSIVLMHDLYSQSADAAVRLIPALIERGYTLVTVSQLAQARGMTLTNGKAYSSFRK